MLQVLLLQLKTFGIRVHHEVLARAGENHDFVFRVRADRLEKLADRAMIFDTQLNGSSSGVRLHEDDAVLAAFQFVMLLESLFVFVELGTLDEIYEGHVWISLSFSNRRCLEARGAAASPRRA